MTFAVHTYLNAHFNIITEHREGDKILSHAGMTPAQARTQAATLRALADLVDEHEQKRAEDATKKEPAAPGPRPGRGYHEEDAEDNEEGA